MLLPRGHAVACDLEKHGRVMGILYKWRGRRRRKREEKNNGGACEDVRRKKCSRI